MMWRWALDPSIDENFDLDGYCGLAGKPVGAG
jgi:hypothetical protein